MLPPSFIEHLTVAVLAVGNWPANRVRAALPALRTAGVLDPVAVAGMDWGELTVRLAKNGYARGLLTSMYAERLQALMRSVADGTLDDLPQLVVDGKQAAFVERLRQIHGVGPKVAAAAWEGLRPTSSPS